MILNIIVTVLCIFVGLFLLSLLVYYFNLDMKLMSVIEPILHKHYDRIKRDKNL